MNKKIKKLLILIITLIFVFISNFSFADVGSFDRYDSGSSWSSSDWGGSSSWSSGSSSSGSDIDLGFFIGMLFGNHFGRGAIIIIVIIIIIYARKHKGGSSSFVSFENKQSQSDISQQKSTIVANQIQCVDSNFNEEKFLSFTKELFIKLQNAWTARDWEPIRLFETPELFEQHRNQVQEYIDKNRINVMDRIAVNYSYLYNYRIDGDKEILEVALKSTMKDYIIDATTKELLEGSKTEDRHTIYKLVFERKKGTLTQKEDRIKTTNCPNCGAPTKITSAGKCEYCGSVIMTSDHGWVLSKLEPFRN